MFTLTITGDMARSQAPTPTVSATEPPPQRGFYVSEQAWVGSYFVSATPSVEYLLETIELDMSQYPITDTQLVGYYVEAANAECATGSCYIDIKNGTLTYDHGATPDRYHTSGAANPANPANDLYTQSGVCNAFTGQGACPRANHRYDNAGAGQMPANIKIYGKAWNGHDATITFTIRLLFYGYRQETCSGQLLDGNMESYPGSPAWVGINPAMGFGRLNENNYFEKLLFGQAACGYGWQITGYTSQLTNVFNRESSPIQQSFCWPGGVLHWKANTRARYLPVLNDLFGRTSWFTIKILSGDGSQTWYLAEDQTTDQNWSAHDGSTSYLPAGNYFIRLEPGASVPSASTENYVYTYAHDVYFDDVQIATYPIDGAVCSQGDNAPPTPTPTGTITPGTATLTQPPWAPSDTPTPTGSPSPTASNTPTATQPPTPIPLNNCDFEQGRYGWNWNNDSLVSDPGGTVGPHIGVAVGTIPGISQQFTHPGTGNGGLYITFWAMGDFQVEYVNVNTMQRYMVWNQSNIPHLTRYALTSAVPAGQYRLELSRKSGGTDATWFDGFTLGSGAYDTTSHCAQLPTAGPSQTSGPTDTPGPTRTATSGPSLTPTPTNTGWPTSTPWPTYTNQPTYTVLPSYTSSPEPATSTPMSGTLTVTPGTPMPGATSIDIDVFVTVIVPPGPGGLSTSYPGSGDQPPPDCYADCRKPQSIFDVSGYIDQATCKGLSYVVWCEQHSMTAEAIPTVFGTYEPWGTINELRDSIGAVQTVVNQYDWSKAGVFDTYGTPMGQDEMPNVELFFVPGNSPYNGGQIDILGQGGSSISGNSTTQCNFNMEIMVGQRLSEGMCFAFSTMDRLGIMPWIQFFINVSAVLAFAFYIRRNWLDDAMQMG